MLFFQQGAVSDKGLSIRDLKYGRFDTALGALLAALAAIATVIATAPLFVNGMDASQFNGAQFAQALEPYVGHVGAALFALGIMEAGFVAAATISTSSAYTFGEVTRHSHSLNLSFKDGKAFYFVLFALLVISGRCAFTRIPVGGCRDYRQCNCRLHHATCYLFSPSLSQ